MHGHKSDLDPTEWKPKLGDGHRNTSEAFRYLSLFHQNMNMNNATMTISNPPSDTPNETPDGLVANVHYNNDTRTTISTTTRSSSVTSLNNTPTTGPSSLDSNMYAHINSYNPSKEHDYHDHTHEHDREHDQGGYSDGYDYDFNLRPLPPRQNPLYYSTSVGAGPGRGIELVTPHVAPPSLSPGTVNLSMTGETLVSSMPSYDHDFWGQKKSEKKEVIGGGNGVGGGGSLFGKAA